MDITNRKSKSRRFNVDRKYEISSMYRNTFRRDGVVIYLFK